MLAVSDNSRDVIVSAALKIVRVDAAVSNSQHVGFSDALYCNECLCYCLSMFMLVLLCDVCLAMLASG